MRAARLAVALACASGGSVLAQQWGVDLGGTAGLTYTDNFFVSPTSPESAFTFSIGPTAAIRRSTENTVLGVNAYLLGNAVTGPPGDNNFWSGGLSSDYAVQSERSTWGFGVLASRSDRLRSVLQPTGVALTRTITDNASANLRYSYQLSERWSANANAGVFATSYDAPGSNTLTQGSLRDSQGYQAGGGLRYAIGPRTSAGVNVSYFVSDSDVSDNSSINGGIDVSHQFTPNLSVTASVAYFHSTITSTQNVLVCPDAPILCQVGLVPFVPVTIGSERTDGGPLYNGTLRYALSERTTFSALLSESITPSTAGTLSRIDSARVQLNHAFTDRLSGLVGASYSQSTFPGAVSSFKNSSYSIEGSLSYALAERWSVSAGVRHTTTNNSGVQGGADAQANSVFVTVRYGWQGFGFEPGVPFGLGDSTGLGFGAPPSLPLPTVNFGDSTPEGDVLPPSAPPNPSP